jgi:heme/copper-type cytochrome/quinol oxidase subunit 3
MPTMPHPPTTKAAGARGVYATEAAQVRAGSLGLLLLLISLAMLFGGLVLAVLVIRLGNTVWPEDLPHLPWQIWVSTGSLLAISLSFAGAVKAAKQQSDVGIRICLVWTGVLAMIFTAMQVWAWVNWSDQVSQLETMSDQHRVAIAGFWIFTGLHVAHVLGGLVPLAMLGWYAVFRTWTNARHGLLRHTAIYWHFLDAVWIVLLLALIML